MQSLYPEIKPYARHALAVQEQHLRVEAGAGLEWLPQETIVSPGANAASRTGALGQPA